LRTKNSWGAMLTNSDAFSFAGTVCGTKKTTVLNINNDFKIHRFNNPIAFITLLQNICKGFNGYQSSVIRYIKNESPRRLAAARWGIQTKANKTATLTYNKKCKLFAQLSIIDMSF